jgi:RNA-dependent RNA polymerase
MLSVDYQLQGRAICIRPSMTKFEAPQMTHIEIARAFDRPSPFYLNRPLIMVLEGLGVPYDTFKRYQDAAVREAQDSGKDLERAARMLEMFGLGASYRLPSVMLHLHKLGVRMPKHDFYQNMMEFAVNHVLRELKHHARIPIPGWTLVGVVDVHDYLEADQVFACVQEPATGKKTYLEGPVVVTR